MSSIESIPCTMTCYPIRLKPGQEIKEHLTTFAKQNGLNGAFVMSCVGSVNSVKLRMSDSKTIKDFNGNFEIVSLVGTLSDGGHLHTSLSDQNGSVFGGHVIGNMSVYTTAEVIIGNCSDAVFRRVQDDVTGYNELSIERIV